MNHPRICSTALLALFGLGVGCKSLTPRLGSANPSAGKSTQEMRPAESVADNRHGKDLWDSVAEKPLTAQENHLNRLGIIANHQYGSSRAILIRELDDLARDLAQARQGRGPWARGGGRDYVANQAATEITQAVDTFSAATDTDCGGTSRPPGKRLSQGLEDLDAAVRKAQAMTAYDFSIRPGIFLSLHDRRMLDQQELFFEATMRVSRTLDKVEAVQAKAGWVPLNTQLRKPLPATSLTAQPNRPRHLDLTPQTL